MSEFTGLRNSITRKCNICGDVREVKARCLYDTRNGKPFGCISCNAINRGKKLRKSHECFIAEMKKIHPDIEVLGKYMTNDKEIECKCLNDGNIWSAMPHSLIGGHGCPECANRIQNRRTHDDFVKELSEKHPNILPIGVFSGVNSKIALRCTKCGYEWNGYPNILLNKKNCGCPKCSNHAKITEDEFIERLKTLNNSVSYVCGYEGIAKHATFRCNICGNEWNTSVSSVLAGNGCPYCKKSKGEKRIKDYLDGNNIQYCAEYKFDDCVSRRNLRFDFYIEKLNMCIEYQGEQHYKVVRFGGKNIDAAIKKFKDGQERDNIKRCYCDKNGIKLIEIPYTDFDKIEEILNECIA